eukprot:360282-Chlamydomonas_euryale.AAC.6
MHCQSAFHAQRWNRLHCAASQLDTPMHHACTSHSTPPTLTSPQANAQLVAGHLDEFSEVCCQDVGQPALEHVVAKAATLRACWPRPITPKVVSASYLLPQSYQHQSRDRHRAAELLRSRHIWNEPRRHSWKTGAERPRRMACAKQSDTVWACWLGVPADILVGSCVLTGFEGRHDQGSAALHRTPDRLGRRMRAPSHLETSFVIVSVACAEAVGRTRPRQIVQRSSTVLPAVSSPWDCHWTVCAVVRLIPSHLNLQLLPRGTSLSK